MARSGNTHTTKRFADGLDMNSAFGVEFLELTKGLPEEQQAPGENLYGFHGNAIATAFEIRESQVMRFDRPIDQWYTGDYARDHSERRLGGRMALISKVREVTV